MSAREASDNGHRTLVLVVDDFADGREICAEYLRFHGYEVLTAADGKVALEIAFESVPDVILMDLALPEVDGWTASRQLKSDDRTRHIPIIALTAHALEGEKNRALEAGCDAVVTKPCLPADLKREVERQLSVSGPEHPSSEAPS